MARTWANQEFTTPGPKKSPARRTRVRAAEAASIASISARTAPLRVVGVWGVVSSTKGPLAGEKT
jgi:hypothetical protein